jgi:hypothetical protein
MKDVLRLTTFTIGGPFGTNLRNPGRTHMTVTTESAVLAGGCWSVQDLLRRYPGRLQPGGIPAAEHQTRLIAAAAVTRKPLRLPSIRRR